MSTLGSLERSLTKQFAPARALSFFGSVDSFAASRFSHVTHVFDCKQIVSSFGVLCVLKCSSRHSFLLVVDFRSLTV